MNQLSSDDNRLFRFYPGDFGELTVRVIHMDLTFDVFPDHTRALSALTAETLDAPVRELALNARNLEILSVTCDTGPVEVSYDGRRNLLTVSFSREVPPRTRFTISTETVCRPSDHILEGLYYDRTPRGAPPTMITQCQQWGFQRLVPCIDDMTAKCTYRTTIIADERYTSIISNGDVSVPRCPVGNGRVSITYDNSITPMAPYLFFLCVGTYAAFSRELEYPDGHTFTLELLVPPGSDPEVAALALQVLADAVMWVYLFTGPESCSDVERRNALMGLVRKRDALKSGAPGGEALEAVRREIRNLHRGLSTGYRYAGTVYREIGMQNSDFGGMENVGNTTIAMNRNMPYPQMTDPAFEYMVRVKVHEFYHNLNGSEVTGRSPFELWLNEAVTAFMEEKYHAFLFGENYSRLQTVLSIMAPSTGTFALDSGTTSLPIEPDGFNDPNDLITGITYVKAAEFVRMVETLMGPAVFARGLDRYHTRFRHGNATWQQWIEAMEEVSGQELMGLARTWLKQTGFPVIEATGEYSPANRRYLLTVRQSFPENGSPWSFPFRAALVDANGQDIAETLARITGGEATIAFESIEAPSFLSLNRGFSCYAKVLDHAGPEALCLQAARDRDAMARFMALYRLAGQEMVRLMDDPAAVPAQEYLQAYHSVLTDEAATAATGGLLLTIFDAVDNPGYSHRYTALYQARKLIQRAIARRYGTELETMYRSRNQVIPLTAPPADQVPAIRERQVKNACLGLLASLDIPRIHALIRDQVREGGVATDRLRAFSLYLESSAPDRLTFMEEFGKEAVKHPVSWEAYLAAVGGCSAPDAVSLIRRAGASPSFRMNQVNDHRALYGTFAANRKVSLETPEGRDLLQEFLVRLAPVNQYSAVSMLRAFGSVDLMEHGYHVPLIGLLVAVSRELRQADVPVVQHTIRRLLLGAPVAVKAYEALHGPLEMPGGGET